jgi:hypothetical protein
MVTEPRPGFFWRRLAFGLALFCTAPLVGAAGSPLRSPTEYEVKAAFLFNFAKFVTWPPTAFDAPDAPLIIGVLGADPFGAELARLAADVKVQGRPLVVKHGTTVAQLAGCHVLFIGASEQDRLAQVLAILHQTGSPALTVGDTENFLSAGGMIRFVMEQNKVRFEIRPEAAANAGLSISSKLLSLALNQRARGSS